MNATKKRRSAVLWAGVGHLAMGVAMAGAILATNQAIDGAATGSEEAVVRWGAIVATVAGFAAIASLVRVRRLHSRTSTAELASERVAYRRQATSLVAAAMGFGAVVGTDRAVALIDHVRARTDDPLTDLTLALQVLVVVILAGGTVVFGLFELRRR